MNEEIEILIDVDGSVTIEGKNIQGPSCKALTREIEEALGSAKTTRLKSEYHQTPVLTRTKVAGR